jgi:hypothetical protein
LYVHQSFKISSHPLKEETVLSSFSLNDLTTLETLQLTKDDHGKSPFYSIRPPEKMAAEKLAVSACDMDNRMNGQDGILF